jgi:predicted MFS family arabinose efflux permease
MISQRAPSVHAIGIAQLVAWGATYYAIPPLLPRIGSDLGIAISTLSIAMTVGLLLNALLAQAVAAWIQQVGARVPMLTGSVVATVALVALASSHGPIGTVSALALLGAAHAALLYEPAFAAVSSQTHDPIARTRAIQIITFWGGWAALWSLPGSSFLGDLIGWRCTLLALAVLLAGHTIHVHARLPIHAMSLGVVPASPAPPISRRLATAFALGAFATTAIVINGLLLLSERDVSLASASMVFALLAPAQVVGRIWFMRRAGRLSRRDGIAPFMLVAAGVIALLAAPRAPALVTFVVLFGSGAGLLTTIRAALVIARVAPEHLATHLGAYSFITSLSRAAAPAASTWIYLAAGYELALLMFAAMAVLAAALIWPAPPLKCLRACAASRRADRHRAAHP